MEQQQQTPPPNAVQDSILSKLDALDSAPKASATEAPPVQPPAPQEAPPATPAVPHEAPADAPKTEEQQAKRLEDVMLARQQKAAEAIKAQAPAPNYEDAFALDPMDAIRTLAKKIVGDDADKLKEFIEGEIYTPLMVEVLGKDADQLDPALRTKLDVKTLNRKLQAEQRARKQHEEAAQKEKAHQEYMSKVTNVKSALTKWIEERSQTYSYLSKQTRPEDVLFDLVDEDSGMTIEKAAELANDYYRRDADRYRDLMLGKPGEAGKSANATNGQHAKPAGLTNSGATAAVTAASGMPENMDDPNVSARFLGDLLDRDPSQLLKRRDERRKKAYGG